MNETLKLGLILLLITAVSAFILAASNNATSAKIEEADKIANDEARKETLPDAKDFEPIDKEKLDSIQSSNEGVLEIFEGKDESGEIVGYTLKNLVGGFGGDIQVMTGISVEGKITGMKILSHSETPGLGAKAEEPEFQERFKGIPTENDLVIVKESPSNNNEVEAITSATITSNAVADGVNLAREIYNSQLSK
ncbi:RnfABCDGE type electron transport complex subunit G [Anaerosalibacter massiliensis]|uniref:Ion-translocating oxidoreductase complex subunit G n=1 Tax=Anaerosalibacter massiliensis TaxID=1347392 RepID=A0A9X2S8D8_9FIRM|nr:RnfABCDGE type electron transport complex subunit G [Anaerosalibacter massiliensis]MCR2045016.1 RnfABCDGE type electron transport complex subunit G [Anaerosalibacter massiliensis]